MGLGTHTKKNPNLHRVWDLVKQVCGQFLWLTLRKQKRQKTCFKDNLGLETLTRKWRVIDFLNPVRFVNCESQNIAYKKASMMKSLTSSLKRFGTLRRFDTQKTQTKSLEFARRLT